MTPPRMYYRGDTLFTTRRTAQGQFLTLPDEAMHQIAGFCTGLGVLAGRVDIHAACWMSNGNHNVFTDPRARCDVFLNQMHTKTTLCRNRQLAEYREQPWGPDGRRGPLWDGQEPNVIALLDDQAILAKIVYTLLNPVEAGMVDHPDDYPGFIILPKHLGQPLEFEVPNWYFSEGMWKPVVFTPAVPPPLKHLEPHEAIEILEELVDAGARAIRNRRAGEGKSALGRERLLQFKPWDFPARSLPRPKLGRPSKEAREDPFAGYDTVPLRVERDNVQVELALRLPPESTEATQRPRRAYRVQEPRSRKQQKKESFKRRYPREFPAQHNPPRFYSTDVKKMERAYGRYNTEVKRYHTCRNAFRAGRRDVVFPAGTVRMRRDVGVRCARAP